MGTGHADLDRLIGEDHRWRFDWLVGVVVALWVATAVGLVALWPRGDFGFDGAGLGLASAVVSAEVTSSVDGPCETAPDLMCRRVVFRVLEGGDAGTDTSQQLDLAATTPDFKPGDRVVLNVIEDADPLYKYQFADRDRRPMLWMLGIAFAAAVVGLGRLRGLAALAGLGASVLVLVTFIAPAILVGHSPVLVAAVGGSAIALLALYLAHGWNPLTHVAAIGTFSALAVTLALSAGFSAAASFSGFATEEALFLVFVDGVNISGLILAGAVLGAIGALDDITVTQASTVFELRRANHAMGMSELVSSGLRVGRDHIASTVNTLLLAYAGASMPLLLLFTLSELPLGFVANSEVVAVEIFRTLVGSIGLVAAVPITTWLAARIVDRGIAPVRPRES